MTTRRRRVLVMLVVAAGMGLLAPASACAQPVREHVFLPRTRGATVLSTYIDAHARMVAALGDYHESVAIARRHHAAAAEHEMRNAVRWVDTYFKRKELNRAYRLKQDPPYLDKIDQRAQTVDRRIRELPELVLQGDLADELNWLLNRLATSTMAYSLWYAGGDRGAYSEHDLPLTPEDIHHLILTESVGEHGSGLTFRADIAKAMDSSWPMALRRREFALVRGEFEEARDEASLEIRTKGELRYETWSRLRDAVDSLAVKLAEVYSREDILTSSEFLHFRKPAEHFIKAQAVGVYRAMAGENLDLFRGDFRFKGDSVIQLIQHACNHGLQFAPHEPGDEPTYRKVLLAMRKLYLHFYPQY